MLDDLLRGLVEHQASDLHLKIGEWRERTAADLVGDRFITIRTVLRLGDEVPAGCPSVRGGRLAW